MPTIAAPEQKLTGSVAMGTIGFDMYLAALGFNRSVLKPSKVPS